MQSIDILVQNYFTIARNPLMTEWIYLFTMLFNPSLGTLTALLLVAVLIWMVRSIRYALLFTFSMFFSSLVVYLLKVSFDVSRPLDGVMLVFGQSFPSFHATIATVFFVMLIYTFDDFLSPFFRILFNTISLVAIFMVAFSRIYLGVHWFSDVFFGVILGALLSYFYIILFRVVISRRGSASMVK